MLFIFIHLDEKVSNDELNNFHPIHRCYFAGKKGFESRGCYCARDKNVKMQNQKVDETLYPVLSNRAYLSSNFPDEKSARGRITKFG